MTDPRSDEAFTREALRELPTIEPSADLLRRVRSIPIEHPRTSGWSWSWSHFWLPALGCAGALALGVFTGLETLGNPSGAGSDEQTATATELAATQFEATRWTAESEFDAYETAEDVESWLALAWGGEDDWETFDSEQVSP